MAAERKSSRSPFAGLASRSSDSGLWLFVPAIVAIIAYSSLVRAEFAFHDDWTFLDTALSPGLGAATRGAISDGRPFFALITELSWSGVRTVAQLSWLRLLAALGVVALSVTVGLWLRKEEVEPPTAWLAAGGILLLAPFTLFVAWSVTWPFPWTAAVAFATGARIHRAAGDSDVSLLDWRLGAGSVVTLAAALLVYPPCALVAFVPAIVGPLATARTEPRRVIRPTLVCGSVFLAAGALAFGIWRLALACTASPVGGRMRIVEASEWGAKLRWFAREPLTRAVDVFVSPEPWRLSAAVALVIAAGLVIGLVRRRASVASGATTVAIGLAATFAAAWLPAGHYFAYRTVAAPALALWLLFVLALREVFLLAARDRWSRPALTLLLVSLVTVQSVRFRQRFAAPFVASQQLELELIREQARRVAATMPQRVELRQIDWRMARIPGRFAEWNGFPSAADRWYGASMLRTATRELGAPWQGEFVLLRVGEAAPLDAPPGVLRIDYSDRFVGRPMDIESKDSMAVP